MCGQSGSATLPAVKSRRPISSPVLGSMFLTKLLFCVIRQTF